ncbi:MAG: hypothetical protein J6M12_08550 [Clostridia bacterium]|nr:hypothetical protein [Clostridia bacterium]
MNYNIDEFEFTVRGRQAFEKTISDPDFGQREAQVIYQRLQSDFAPVPFCDYLKRYIYRKAGLQGDPSSISPEIYVDIVVDSFKEHETGASFDRKTTKVRALAKNWLTQQSARREVVFLLGFGLGMSLEDVEEFLEKALREPYMNVKDPLEVICRYCFKKGYSFGKAMQLLDIYRTLSPSKSEMLDEPTSKVRIRADLCSTDQMFLSHLACIKGEERAFRQSVSAREQFDRLYEAGREMIAEFYNRPEQWRRHMLYGKDLLGNLLVLPEEERTRNLALRFPGDKSDFKKEQIKESDFERVILSAIPRNAHGNLYPCKDSTLSSVLGLRRLSAQRLGAIRRGEEAVDRFDLLTLLFFVYSQSLYDFPDPAGRRSSFEKEANGILSACGMGQLYYANPYEAFLMLCLSSELPLCTYADVWELSYGAVITPEVDL